MALQFDAEAFRSPPQLHSAETRRLRVLFLVDGFTDIRFVSGLSEIFDLTMVVPRESYRESGLGERIAGSRCPVSVSEIPGRRVAFQFRSLAYVWRCAHEFDAILALESLRGALSANLAALRRRVPVVTYVGTSPLEYFRCRRERRQIGRLKAIAGEMAIRLLLTINARLVTRCLAVGPYLHQVMAHYHPGVGMARHCGVDVQLLRPACTRERSRLRRELGLPPDKFVVLFASRVSHEKDPETVLRAVWLARSRGLDAVVLNLGGGYREFRALAREMALPGTNNWVIARPAVHPIAELPGYLKAADLLAQASLAEGAGFSPLEALACGTPVVASAVGGMAILLKGYARLTPRRDADAMADEILWVARNRQAARAQALAGREFIVSEWNREKAFAELSDVLREVCAVDSIE
jgi:glycosyltransferase involved in cell wall biosynthesis